LSFGALFTMLHSRKSATQAIEGEKTDTKRRQGINKSQ